MSLSGQLVKVSDATTCPTYPQRLDHKHGFYLHDATFKIRLQDLLLGCCSG